MHHLTSQIEAKYDCLSCRWGDAQPEHGILLNGKPFNVRQNSFDYLAFVSKCVNPQLSLWAFPMWIDALCIDQPNLLERNQQAAQMGHIFSCANRVKIWLGRTAKMSAICSSSRTNDSFTNLAAQGLPLDFSFGDSGPLLANLLDMYYFRRPLNFTALGLDPHQDVPQAVVRH